MRSHSSSILDKLPLLLGKIGSSHAEQNHSSHIAYLGSSGGAREIEEHIEGIIRRQSERVSQKRRRDYDHMTRYALCAKKRRLFTYQKGQSESTFPRHALPISGKW
jgi:hypothetical protein